MSSQRFQCLMIFIYSYLLRSFEIKLYVILLTRCGVSTLWSIFAIACILFYFILFFWLQINLLDQPCSTLKHVHFSLRTTIFLYIFNQFGETFQQCVWPNVVWFFLFKIIIDLNFDILNIWRSFKCGLESCSFNFDSCAFFPNPRRLKLCSKIESNFMYSLHAPQC